MKAEKARWRRESGRTGVAVLLPMILLQHAAHAGPNDRNAAEELFRAGRDAMKAGNYALACSHFEQSNHLEPGVGTWLNLGICEEKSEKLTGAWNYFQRVLLALPANDPRHVLAARHVAALGPRVPRIAIRLAHDAPGATVVTFDGIAYEATYFGVPLAVTASNHSIVVTSPGRIPRQYEILVPEGQSRELTVEPGPLAPSPSATADAPNPTASAVTGRSAADSRRSSPSLSVPSTVPPSAPHEVESHSHNKTWGWALTGAGVGFLSISGITGRMVIERRSIVERECSADKACTPEGINAGKQGAALSWVSTGAFLLGGVGLGVGMYFLLTPNRVSQAPLSYAPRIEASPLAGGLMISHTGSFDFD